MKLLELIRADRRLPLLGLTALLAIILGFFSLSPEAALAVIREGWYWMMLGTVVWFGWALWQLAREDRPWVAWRERPAWGTYLLVLIGGVLLLLRDTVLTQPTSEGAAGEEGHESAQKRMRQWREVGIGAQILRDLGIASIRLLAAHRRHYIGLSGFGIEIAETELLEG